MDALAAAGFYGLISARELGGMGQGPGAAALAVLRVARECGSTGMVLAMHYAGTSVIEKYGAEAIRRDIVAGKHMSTLAFSEAGSRSHFWTPTSTAKAVGGHVELDAEKSWITSAGSAAAYVWSSRPSLRWGLAARGAKVEQGSPSFDFPITEKEVVWADEAAAQWDPATAIDWAAPITHPPEIEDTVVQVMTFLIENETAALIVPASFLAIQAADEARHIEVFTRRALLLRKDLGLSTAGGQESLKILLEEPDFALAFFLLSILGEGSFLSLLWFLHENAPDPITREVARLAAQDEARHVAFGLAHLRRHLDVDPGLRPRLAAAVLRRHDALADTAGLNEEVFDALVVLAAGSWDHAAIASGYERVVKLQADMDHARRLRLLKLGFAEHEAEALSALHTRNFM